ncbi:hypothetical protein ACFXTI_041510 [Malus domestica]
MVELTREEEDNEFSDGIGRIDTPGGTTIHLTTPNGIVNVNSLFSLAVFIALTWNPSDPSNRLIEDDTTACLPGPLVAEDLVINTMNLMKK